VEQRELGRAVGIIDGDAIAAIADVVNVVEAQDVGREGSQACEDAWIAANATVVFAN